MTNAERYDCQPTVYNNKFTGDGHEGWSWVCCWSAQFDAGLHHERLYATEEAYAHKVGEF